MPSESRSADRERVERGIAELARRQGELFGRFGPITIDLTTVQRYERAVAWHGPSPWSERDPVSPGLIAYLSREEPRLDRDARPRPPFGGRFGTSMNGGTAIHVYSPVYVGDTISGERRLLSATTREGSAGLLGIVVMRTTFYDAAGREIAAAEFTTVHRS